MFNKYSTKARLFPAVLTALPVILVKHYILDVFFEFSLNQVIFGDISIAVVLIYLFIQINRFISKKLFENKKNFLTDQKLLPSSKTISEEYREKLAKKIKKDFDLNLPNIREENDNKENVVLRIREIIKSIIDKVRGGHLLLQHNIEYGFMRNFIGGSVIASLVSFINIFVFYFLFKNDKVAMLSVVLLIIYIIPIIFSKKILDHYSEEYTNVLFREYLNNNT